MPRQGSSSASRAAGTGESYKAGERVRHAKFGEGEVVEATETRLVVRFGRDEKILVPGLAPLSKV